MQSHELQLTEDDHLADELLLRYQSEAMSPAECEHAEAHFQVCRERRCFRRIEELGMGKPSSGPGEASVVSVPPDLKKFGYFYEREASGAICTPPGVDAKHEVYLAIRIEDRLRVVVKFFRGDWSDVDSAQARLRFIEEPAATHQLQHDNIVSILDIHSVDGRCFYVMQYVGPSLNRYQSGWPFWARLDLAPVDAAASNEPTILYVPSSGPAPPQGVRAAPPIPAKDAATVRTGLKILARRVMELAETIDTAHRRSIVHRDLKPDNILVREDGTRRPERLLITDFGILHHLNVSSTSLVSTAIGTRNYMAPEQLDNTQPLSPATDIYGLGGVFYFMLTGQAPLLFGPQEDWRKEDWKNRVRTEPPTPPRQLHPCIPAGLEAICLKALEKQPGRRYQSGTELAKDLQRFLAGARPWATYPPWLRGAAFWVRRHPLTAAVVSLLCGLLTIAVVFMITTLTWYTTAVQETARAEDAYRHAARKEAEATSEKLRAERGEASAKEQARDNLMQAARFALSRGQRLEALALFDRLLPELPAEEQLACRVERLPCMFAYSQWKRLLPELKELQAVELPAKLRAKVLLHQGDVAFWRLDIFPSDEGRKHLAAALSLADGLHPADAEYARGLLADGSLPAIEHYKKSLVLNPFHPRARVNLLFELLFSGQFELAERQLEIASASFPQEPLVPTAGLWLTIVQQRPKDREPFLNQLRQQLPKEHFDKLKDLSLAMDVGIKAFSSDTDFGTFVTAWAFFANPLRPIWNNELGPLIGVASPTIQHPFEVFKGLAQVFLHFTIGDAQGACTQCAALSQKYPESWFRLAHAMARAQLAVKYQQAGKYQEMLKEHERCFELLAEARRSPTLLPNSQIHRHAAWFSLALQAARLEERRQISQGTAIAMLQPQGLPGSSLLFPAVQLSTALTMLGQHPDHYDRSLVSAVALESNGFDSLRTAILPKVIFFLPIDDGRFLLSDWEADEPSSIVPLHLRARLELARGNVSEARRYAVRALAREPQNGDIRKLLDQLRSLDQARR